MSDGEAAGQISHVKSEQDNDKTDKEDAARPLSRKAQKRLIKQQHVKELRLLHRVAKKESRKAESAKKREEAAQFLAQLDPEEADKFREKARLRGQKRKEESTLHKQKLKDAMVSGICIVIDLNFDDLMTQKEVKSLCQQLSYSYSANTKAECPAHLHFTSLKGRIRELLGKHASGFTSWHATHLEESYEKVFAEQKGNLVYLTADAKETLDTLEPHKIYVIGGIVDRNRHKGICENRAKAQGIQTARLPIEAHVKLAGTRVVTVNQAYEILLQWLACKDWGEAAQKVVPIRKQAKGEERDNGKGDLNAALEPPSNLQNHAKEFVAKEDCAS